MFLNSPIRMSPSPSPTPYDRLSDRLAPRPSVAVLRVDRDPAYELEAPRREGSDFMLYVIVFAILGFVLFKTVPVLFRCHSASQFAYAYRDAAAEPVTKAHEAQSVDEVEGHNSALVMFYATWCQHCTAFKETFDEIAQKLHAKYGDKIKVMKIEQSHTTPEQLNKHKVTGFPQIMFNKKTPQGAVHSEEVQRQATAADFVDKNQSLWDMM